MSGALIGLRKMLTSPFGPAILISIAMGTIIWFLMAQNDRLETKLEKSAEERSTARAAKNIAESERERAQDKLESTLKELKATRKAQRIAEERARKKAIIELEKDNEPEKIEAKELTEWYKNL